MEQEEKKQKSQAAENQASCPPQQPASPHPFISVIPLAVLIALIVLSLSNSSLTMPWPVPPKGGPYDSHCRMCGTRHGHL